MIGRSLLGLYSLLIAWSLESEAQLLGCPPTDLGLLLDSSGSLFLPGQNNEGRIEAFVEELVGSFDVIPGINGTHVGIVQFDSNPKLLYKFTQTQTLAAVTAAIKSYKIGSGRTMLNRGIDMCADELFQTSEGMRGPEYKKVLIIFTDGTQSQNPNLPTKINPKDNAQVLKNRNVTVFSVGAGSVDPIELLQMSSGYPFVVPLDLRKPREAVAPIIQQLCKVEVTVSLELCSSKEVRHS